MAFVFVKVLSIILYPVFTSIVLIAFGTVLRLSGKRLGYFIACVGLVYLSICSTNQFGNWLAVSLEEEYGYVEISETPKADAILVLGGGIGSVGGKMDLNSSADRVLHGSRLLKAEKAPLIVVTGGDGYSGSAESGVMVEFLADLGIGEELIVEESQSLTTYEHTLFLGEVFEEKGIRSIILVTSAWHMRRSMAVFESNMLDLEIFPFPVDSELGETGTLIDYLPTSDGLMKTTKMIKEYIGYLLYDVRGWID